MREYLLDQLYLYLRIFRPSLHCLSLDPCFLSLLSAVLYLCMLIIPMNPSMNGLNTAGDHGSLTDGLFYLQRMSLPRFFELTGLKPINPNLGVDGKHSCVNVLFYEASYLIGYSCYCCRCLLHPRRALSDRSRHFETKPTNSVRAWCYDLSR
jgi:hypothetical protein